MNDVQRAIERLNRALDLQEARAAAKALAGALANAFPSGDCPSQTIIDGWDLEECHGWGDEVAALPAVIALPTEEEVGG